MGLNTRPVTSITLILFLFKNEVNSFGLINFSNVCVFLGIHLRMFSATYIANTLAKRFLLIVEIIIIPLGFKKFLIFAISFFQSSKCSKTSRINIPSYFFVSLKVSKF